MTATQAISGFGTFLQVDQGGGVWRSVAEIFAITPPGLERVVIDVTHHESPQAFREFILGLLSVGSPTINVNYLPTDPTHADILQNLGELTLADQQKNYRVCWPNYGETSEEVVAVASIAVGNNVITTSGNHGLETGQPLLLRSDGTMPTGNITVGNISTGNITLPAGRIYFASVLSLTTLLLHGSSYSAAGNLTPIDLTTAGSGNLTLLFTSTSEFVGMVKSFQPKAVLADRLNGDIVIQVTGPITIPGHFEPEEEE